jgi:hypothetical protein
MNKARIAEIESLARNQKEWAKVMKVTSILKKDANEIILEQTVAAISDLLAERKELRKEVEKVRKLEKLTTLELEEYYNKELSSCGEDADFVDVIKYLRKQLTQKDAELKAERSMVSTLNIKIDNQKEEIERRLNQIKELKGK